MHRHAAGASFQEQPIFQALSKRRRPGFSLELGQVPSCEVTVPLLFTTARDSGAHALFWQTLGKICQKYARFPPHFAEVTWKVTCFSRADNALRIGAWLLSEEGQEFVVVSPGLHPVLSSELIDPKLQYPLRIIFVEYEDKEEEVFCIVMPRNAYMDECIGESTPSQATVGSAYQFLEIRMHP